MGKDLSFGLILCRNLKRSRENK